MYGVIKDAMIKCGLTRLFPVGRFLVTFIWNILLVIPVLWFLGIRIFNFLFGQKVPIGLQLSALNTLKWKCNSLFVWSRCANLLKLRIGVCALCFWLCSTKNYHSIDVNFVGVVGVDDQSVQMSEVIVLASNILLDQVLFAFVVENDMNFAVGWATNV